MKYRIVSIDGKEIHPSLSKFRSERAAQDKLRELTERGIIAGIPLKIVASETVKQAQRT